MKTETHPPGPRPGAFESIGLGRGLGISSLTGSQGRARSRRPAGLVRGVAARLSSYHLNVLPVTQSCTFLPPGTLSPDLLLSLLLLAPWPCPRP